MPATFLKNGGENSASQPNNAVFHGATTLRDFGYAFNERGELRHVATNESFEFAVKKGDQKYNQQHYEALGEVITEEIYRMLENHCDLQKIFVPFDTVGEESRGFLFASEDAQINENLLIVIHGSGVVRAGQWSRKLIINENLTSGTQISYIEKAIKELKWGVVVLNTNQNKILDNSGETRFIRESEDPLSHALHVWDHFVVPSQAKNIAIVAHSAGGYVTVSLATKRPVEFIKRVFAVTFTDSVHSVPKVDDSEIWKHLKKVGQNWVTSREPLDTLVNSSRYVNDIPRVSAGTTVHESTSHTSIESIFAFLNQKFFDQKAKNVETIDDHVTLPVDESDHVITESEESSGHGTVDGDESDHVTTLEDKEAENISFIIPKSFIPTKKHKENFEEDEEPAHKKEKLEKLEF